MVSLWLINWNKYQSKITIQASNQYLHYLINISYHESLFSYQYIRQQKKYGKSFLPNVEIKYYNKGVGRVPQV